MMKLELHDFSLDWEHELKEQETGKCAYISHDPITKVTDIRLY